MGLDIQVKNQKETRMNEYYICLLLLVVFFGAILILFSRWVERIEKKLDYYANEMVGEAYLPREICEHYSYGPQKVFKQFTEDMIKDSFDGYTKFKMWGWVNNKNIFYYDRVYDLQRRKVKRDAK